MSEPPPPIRVSREHLWRLHARLQHRLPHWTIYRPPTHEYGPQWVARMWLAAPVLRSTRFTMTHDTLAELREQLPPGLARLDRQPDDEPVIVETWI